MFLSRDVRLRCLRSLMRVCFFALFALLPAASPALAQRIPISSCPFVISRAGSYVLTHNLSTNPNNDCIVVKVGSVFIDLNGFTITGAKVAIHARHSRAVVVQNGTIRLSAFDGIVLGNNGVVENVQSNVNNGSGVVCAIHCIITDTLANSNGAQGIQVLAAATISNNTVSYNGLNGIYCKGDKFSAAECKISGNTATLNGQSVDGGSGIVAGSSSVIESNTVNNNFDDGIVASSSTIAGNAVNGNGRAGIVATSGSLVSSNTANGNGKASHCTPLGGGITVVSQTNCAVGAGGVLAIGNTATGNAGFGIDLGGDPTNGYQNNVAFDNNETPPPTVSGQINPGTSLGNNLCNGVATGC
ncbi:MAG TPA: right-handed parallel beta-helix repeat-containing protein [Stellaceae bacterium]|nr:right-handed parallel beta-helix repeat-containing protein [Stellaceae bacterium]